MGFGSWLLEVVVLEIIQPHWVIYAQIMQTFNRFLVEHRYSELILLMVQIRSE